MIVPIIKIGRQYYIDIDMDKTPYGFEDALEKSLFKRRLDLGTLFGEYRYPDTIQDLTKIRFSICEARNISHYFTNAQHDVTGTILRLELKGHGPLTELFYQYVENDKQPKVVFRLAKIDDHVVDIYTADLGI